MSVVFEDRANGLTVLDDKTRDFIASVDLKHRSVVVVTKYNNLEVIKYSVTIDGVDYIFSNDKLSPGKYRALTELIDLAEYIDEVRTIFATNW